MCARRMKKVLLLYNPYSGRKRHLREDSVASAVAVFRNAGVEAVMAATHAPGSAGDQAKAAIAQGCQAVIACGGDGTFNEVLQGVAGTGTSIGFIPLGTGNALGEDLGLPRDPAQAAQILLRAEPRPVPLGRVDSFSDGSFQSRYFLMIAGVGADAEMLYRLAFGFKSRYGMLAYYSVATQVWLGHKFVPFTVDFNDLERSTRRREQVTQILAVHIKHFGGLLRSLSPAAALHRGDFQLVMFKTRSRIRYLHFVMGVMSARHWSVPGVEVVRTDEVVCTPMENSSRVYTEADGELLGTLPAMVRMLPETVSVLIPEGRLREFDLSPNRPASMAPPGFHGPGSQGKE